MTLQTKQVATFGIGVTLGILMALLISSVTDVTMSTSKKVSRIRQTAYGSELGRELRPSKKDKDILDNKILFPNEKILTKEWSRTLQSVHSHEEIDRLPGPKSALSFTDGDHHHDNSLLASQLYKKVRVLCWVLTSPDNLEKKAIHVRATWGKRCNKLLFMSSVTNTSFPTIGLNISEGRDHLTAKTMRAFDYVADHYMDEADWFMKADDDTFVILENLRYFLSDIDTNTPVFYGHKFKVIVKQGYMSGGGGYVLSKEALRRFRGRDPKLCRADGGAEDVELGSCMEKIGVKAGYSLDSLKRSRFHCFDPETHFFGGYPPWYYTYDANNARKGVDSVSDYAITFHYIPPHKMYSLEFYVYHLRPYGLVEISQSLNHENNHTQKTNKTKV